APIAGELRPVAAAHGRHLRPFQLLRSEVVDTAHKPDPDDPDADHDASPVGVGIPSQIAPRAARSYRPTAVPPATTPPRRRPVFPVGHPMRTLLALPFL